MVYWDVTNGHRRTGTIRLGGGGALFARKNYAVPHCLIVEISYLLPQNVRKNMRLQSLKGIKLYVLETQFLEPHILYVSLLIKFVFLPLIQGKCDKNTVTQAMQHRRKKNYSALVTFDNNPFCYTYKI